MFQKNLISKIWNAEYSSGKYLNEPPLYFVRKILDILSKYPEIRNGRGLYIGCGNGRNFIPLVNSGLNLLGIDISKVALDSLSRRLPLYSQNLLCEDFRNLDMAQKFEYIISIQVFQHGLKKDVTTFFDKVYDLIKSGGLFFLRVNSSSTKPYFRHSVIEKEESGSKTIVYNEGPKKSLKVHFFSLKELMKSIENRFELIENPKEDINLREPPKSGYWSQWELVLRKK